MKPRLLIVSAFIMYAVLPVPHCTAAEFQVRPVLIVDNSDREFSSTSGVWNSSMRDKGYFGNDYLWCGAGDGAWSASWSFEPPIPGTWNVYARWVMTMPTDRATNAPFTILGTDSSVTVRVNMALPHSAARYPAGKLQSPWNLLGSFRFLSRRAEIRLSNDADNSVVADAVRLEFMAPEGAVDPAEGELLFSDDFNGPGNWIFEGSGEALALDGRLSLLSNSDETGVAAWFTPVLNDGIIVEYDMHVRSSNGTAALMFSAIGPDNTDLLAETQLREGYEEDYTGRSGPSFYQITVHRAAMGEILGGAELRKNPGDSLMQRAATDPCPPADSMRTYHMRLLKFGPLIELRVDGARVLYFIHDGFIHDEGGLRRDASQIRFPKEISPTPLEYSVLPRPPWLPRTFEPDPWMFYGSGRFGLRQTFRGKVDYSGFRVYRAVAQPLK